MGDDWNILSLNDIGCHDDIPETCDTLQGNAEQKARYIRDRYGLDCFADDTGLMVDALGGAPGVYSARYAGPGHDSKANMKLLLRNLEGNDDRKAHFSTVIALILGSDTIFFEGRVDGVITESPSGIDGFGYDPVFRPDGFDCTFAQMSSDEKNAISHRGRATAKLIHYLNSNN
ncbi:MAG: RdgB/HAM1 family non-canonical purine NTP pyrophosphatase [Bacteroides sp.]|nr:RdgB/HAM1 family non-canonical purine NTP pyrophosphatase [Bacteroides sp.]MCM1413737.1 RdgB/HAM1 family non-canonical purine NTP pyrophosphatase [Bacteroides sp.]MCM1472244.1 RdgB/HAM1 family non-canonical purine NTP pyrophosphatase [Bacteroides sp.]